MQEAKVKNIQRVMNDYWDDENIRMNKREWTLAWMDIRMYEHKWTLSRLNEHELSAH